MATIKKHVSKAGKITYYIRTYDGYDSKGKQIERSMTWVPPEGMSQKQIEKELQKQAVKFEESVRGGTCFDSDIVILLQKKKANNLLKNMKSGRNSIIKRRKIVNMHFQPML